MLQRITAGFKRPLDRQPLSKFHERNASVILLSFYCISLVLIKSVLIKPVLIKSFEMKRPFMAWIGFISICCSKVAKEGKSCLIGCRYYRELPKTLKVAQKLPSTIYLCLVEGIRRRGNSLVVRSLQCRQVGQLLRYFEQNMLFLVTNAEFSS